ncbi:MAG: hypothetical protein LBH01_01020 [Verrucomicrobiales bacterium]|jgi:hypothetical protein|nr:hypothetical protein [Verrucomicrobiales bacterium]
MKIVRIIVTETGQGMTVCLLETRIDNNAPCWSRQQGDAPVIRESKEFLRKMLAAEGAEKT